MKSLLSTSLRLLLAVALLVSTFAYLGKSEILDPGARHPLLRLIADDLDRNGIDVVQNWRSKVPEHARPVVAPLANYPISLTRKEQRWIRDFNKGVMGAIAAIKTREITGPDSFAAKWKSTPKSQRVFISFAREDVAHAQRVKAALDAKGYVAFIYINQPGTDPSQPPIVVGEYLRTAGTHLVIDTDVARRKPGVLAEALAFARYRSTRPASAGAGSAVAGRSPTPDSPGGNSGTATKPKRHIVDIYGAKKRCPRTQQAIKLFKDAGAIVRYHDVDTNPRASRIVDRNTRFLANGELLPFIRLDGKPVHATNTGIGEALMVCEKPIP
jgi:hypothetical protein